MAKNRYKPNGDDGKNLSFSGKLKILEAVNRKLFRVEVWALNNEVNRNGWKYINLDSHLSEFEDIPLLTAYLQDGTIGDGHNYDTKVDPATGKEYVSFTAPDAERIVGWVPKNAPRRIERDGGTDWVVVTGYLWAWYSKELVDKIAGQGGGLDVSVETLVTKEHRENGVDVEEEYLILGITILGNGVRPAVPGANIQALAAMRASSERREILKAASLDDAPHGTNKPEKQGVRVNMLSKKRLDDLTAKFNGFTCIGASEDTKVLALLNESGDPHLYVSEDSDMGSVIPERIRQASATVTFSAGDDNVQTDFESALTVAMSRCNAAEKELKETKERLEAVEKSLSTAVNREKSRRLEAAKSACSDELARINQNRPEDRRFSDELCKDLMAGAETLPYLLSRYLMDMESPGYTPPSDNRYPRARLKKLLYWDGERPLSQPLPTGEQIRTILFDPELPANPPDEKRGYRVFAQDLTRQSQYNAQSILRIALGEITTIRDRNRAVYRQTVIYTIMTNYAQEANLGTPGNSRSYAMLQAIMEATEGVNVGGVGPLFMSRVTKVDDERANLGYKLYQYVDWYGTDEHPTFAE